MSAEDVFALAALMAGLATIAAILAGAYKRRLAFQERKLAITATQTAEKAAQYASEKGHARSSCAGAGKHCHRRQLRYSPPDRCAAR
ncbi:hypothetical protein ACFSTD_22650 [Novosphingobium colocasiae]